MQSCKMQRCIIRYGTHWKKRNLWMRISPLVHFCWHRRFWQSKSRPCWACSFLNYTYRFITFQRDHVNALTLYSWTHHERVKVRAIKFVMRSDPGRITAAHCSWITKDGLNAENTCRCICTCILCNDNRLNPIQSKIGSFEDYCIL